MHLTFRSEAFFQLQYVPIQNIQQHYFLKGSLGARHKVAESFRAACSGHQLPGGTFSWHSPC